MQRSQDTPPIGIIAGQGRLPLLVAEGARAAGRRVCAVGLAGQYDAELPSLCDRFRSLGIAQLGRWIRCLRRWGVHEVVMVGRVAHKRKHARLVWLRYPPDLLAFRLWYTTLRHDRRTATMLTALADALHHRGVTLIDSRRFIGAHMAYDGLMTPTVHPTIEMQRDLEFGWPLLLMVASNGIGQAIAVRACDVLAVEAAEGTDALIERAGALCDHRPWILLKSSAPAHDMRAVVATVGVRTIEHLHANGGRALVLGDAHVIMIDRKDVIRRAEELGICIIGRAVRDGGGTAEDALLATPTDALTTGFDVH
ncbi:MAG: LpxI family protein [Planctomycetota bacterium]